MKHQARQLCESPQSTVDIFGPWSCSAHRPGTIVHPEQLEDAAVEWLPTTVPCTVASALAANRKWSFDAPTDLDAHDWWFRTTFARPDLAGADGNASPCVLCFDGLASLAEVWLNGEVILTTDNMLNAAIGSSRFGTS